VPDRLAPTAAGMAGEGALDMGGEGLSGGCKLSSGIRRWAARGNGGVGNGEKVR